MRKALPVFLFILILAICAAALQNAAAPQTVQAQDTPPPTPPEVARVEGRVTPPQPDLDLQPKTPETFVAIVSSPEEGDLLSISVNPPTIRASPSSWTLPKTGHKVSRNFVLEPPAGKRLTGEIEIGAELTRPSQNGPGESLAGATYRFVYRQGIPLSSYFMWGILGIVIGYFLRLFLKVLSEVTPEAPAPVANQSAGKVGWITRLVKRHYYLVDCAVTAAIGFLVLVALVQDGQPPQNATYWYTALAMGVGLGLLTNSELLTKIPR